MAYSSHSQDTPNWAYAPRNATHWGPDNGDYVSAWYVPLPASYDREDDPDSTAWCYADRGEDLSKTNIPTNHNRNTSSRPLDQLIQRPGLNEGNDIDNW